MAKTAIEEAAEALAFYAKPETYAPHPHGPAFDRRDVSYTARAAIQRMAAAGYDPHELRGHAQDALNDAIERAGIDVDFCHPAGDIGGEIDINGNEAGVRAIEEAMIKLLHAHGITKRKPV